MTSWAVYEAAPFVYVFEVNRLFFFAAFEPVSRPSDLYKSNENCFLWSVLICWAQPNWLIHPSHRHELRFLTTYLESSVYLVLSGCCRIAILSAQLIRITVSLSSMCPVPKALIYMPRDNLIWGECNALCCAWWPTCPSGRVIPANKYFYGQSTLITFTIGLLQVSTRPLDVSPVVWSMRWRFLKSTSDPYW